MKKEQQQEHSPAMSSSSSSSLSNNQTFVIDCRTPIEFAQRSQIEAANITLADFRNWLLFRSKISSSSWNICENIKEWMNFEQKQQQDQTIISQNDDNNNNNDDNQDKNNNKLMLNILPSRSELFVEVASSNADAPPQQYHHHHTLFHPSELKCFKKLEQILFGFNSSNNNNTNNNHTQFLIYCAGGYRSRIFMSMMESIILSLTAL